MTLSIQSDLPYDSQYCLRDVSGAPSDEHRDHRTSDIDSDPRPARIRRLGAECDEPLLPDTATRTIWI
jgi:hypothetical protein